MVTEADALRFVAIFMATPFSGEARHARRIAQLGDYEKTGKLPEVRRAP
jgi:ribose 5-phosphate isomerase B